MLLGLWRRPPVQGGSVASDEGLVSGLGSLLDALNERFELFDDAGTELEGAVARLRSVDDPAHSAKEAVELGELAIFEVAWVTDLSHPPFAVDLVKVEHRGRGLRPPCGEVASGQHIEFVDEHVGDREGELLDPPRRFSVVEVPEQERRVAPILDVSSVVEDLIQRVCPEDQGELAVRVDVQLPAPLPHRLQGLGGLLRLRLRLHDLVVEGEPEHPAREVTQHAGDDGDEGDEEEEDGEDGVELVVVGHVALLRDAPVR